ncbi:MAG: cadherin-like beta sandwich domain-containing protein [Mariniphaga sp.]
MKNRIQIFRSFAILLLLVIGSRGLFCFSVPVGGLTSIVLSSGTLSPTYSVAITSYTCPEVYAIASVTVTPTASTGTIQVKVNSGSYATVTTGTASAALPLSVGSNTISVQYNGSATYTITVTRAAAPPTNKYGKITGGVDYLDRNGKSGGTASVNLNGKISTVP